MGTDIHGVIEVKPHWTDRWRPVGRIDNLVSRNYDMFSSLFGVRGHAGFEAMWPDRGLPNNAGWKTERMLDDEEVKLYCHSEAYFTLEEMNGIDWDETSPELDSRISVLDDDGNYKMKAGYMPVFDEFTDEQWETLNRGDRLEWVRQDGVTQYFVRQQMTRHDAMSDSWEWFIFTYLPTFGERFGPENVRVLVWFDS